MYSVDFYFIKEFWANNLYFKFYPEIKKLKVVSTFWEFGDGKTSIDVNPRHNYLEKGVYIVSLTVLTTDNEEITVSKEIEIDFGFKVPDFSEVNVKCNINDDTKGKNRLEKKPSNFKIALWIVLMLLIIILIVAFTDVSEFLKDPTVKIILIILSVVTTIMSFLKR